MSAYEVDYDHIGYLVNLADALQRTAQHPGGGLWVMYSGHEVAGERPIVLDTIHDHDEEVGYHLCDEDNPTRGRRWLTRELIMTNRESVGYLYRETVIDPDTLPTFERKTPRIDRPADLWAAWGAVECYEYQTCEHPGWQTSFAYTYCQALRRAIIDQLWKMVPGKGERGWGAPSGYTCTIDSGPVRMDKVHELEQLFES